MGRADGEVGGLVLRGGMIAETQASSDLQLCRVDLTRQVDQGTFSLPVLPTVAGEVLALTSDPDADLVDLSKLIHRDQGLASHILRVANSAAYGSDVAIVSLQQAVTRLGMKLLGETALAISVHREVFQASGFESDLKRIWQHALAAGSYGKEIARMKRHNVEGQFLCSLLHTVGQPVVLQGIVRWQQTNRRRLDPANVRILVDELHTLIGERVARQWKLPQQVQAACAYYRSYAEAPLFQKESAMTYLSNRLATWLGPDETLDDPTLAADPAFAHLNFYPDEVEALLEKKESVLAVVQAINA